MISGIRSQRLVRAESFITRPVTTTSGNYASQLINKLIKPSPNPGIAQDPGKCADALLCQRRQRWDQRGRYVEVDAVLTSAAMSMAVGEIFAADISFDVNGAPSETSI